MDTKKIPLLALIAIGFSVSSIVVHATDSDGDGISDLLDNCPFVYNPGQEDSDMQPLEFGCGDGYCDWPEDSDWCPQDCHAYCLPYASECGNGGCETESCWPESYLSCPSDCPPPAESDGYGDVCDNCPNHFNPDQLDSDSDTVGDDCDNCPNDFNPDQLDFDSDAVGDDCDNCPETYNPRQADADGDGLGNACDEDCPNLDELSPVNMLDFSAFSADWMVADVNLPGDLDFDGMVDVNDLAILAAYWLSHCPE
ncbi:MAG: thrombospondin type 3 repeat-containing protein [Planctomycetota bacterium]|jgi:hypothetical protein